MEARPWVAHTQYDLAVALTRRDGPGDQERVEVLIRSAQATASALRMTVLDAKIRRVPSGQPTRSSTTPESNAAEATYLREGDVWAIGRDTLFRLKHTKGLGYLSVLLANPGREFHVLQLAGADASVVPHQVAWSEAKALGLAADSVAGDSILDAEARAAYRERLDELRPELDDAERDDDTERAARIRAEIEAITDQLSAAFGLGGRARSQGSAAERARQSVTKAIRDALRRIAAEDMALGDHLTRAVRTGVYCSYDPDPAASLVWRTDARV
jgi:hypothetical protein